MVKLVGAVAYAAFLLVFVTLIGFVGGVGPGPSVDAGPAASTAAAAAIDLGLIAFFGAAHSVMARRRFKDAWTRVVPPAAERSVYVLVAAAQLALLMWQWRPITSPVLWSTGGAAARAIQAVAALGWGIALLSSFLIDHFELFGLRQSFGRPAAPTGLRTPLLYRWVRHPLYLGMFIALWAAPVMTAGHLLLSAALSAYVAIGARHEERDLVRIFGDDYRDYQRRVPMLVPGTLIGWRRGSASSRGPAGGESPTPSTATDRS